MCRRATRRYRAQASSKSELPAGWTTTYRHQDHLSLSCWSIDNNSRCSSYISQSADLPLTASTAPGLKTPDSRRP